MLTMNVSHVLEYVLNTDTRGTVTVEYIVLLCLVSVGCVGAMIGLGAPLVQMFMVQEVWLSLGVP
jgi:Flp pilus assembly pilin Flp